LRTLRSIGREPVCADRAEQSMLDIILLLAGLGFFAVAIAYAFGCERL
jgi:hypothetical protein